MRYLHLAWNGAGNLPPQLALLERLRDAGHDVISVVEPEVRPAFEALGIRTHSASCTPRPDGLYGEQEMFDTFGRYVFGPTWGDDLLELTDRERPDRLLVDGMLWDAAAAAERTKLPTALLWHSLFATMIESPFADFFQAQFGERHAARRDAFGLLPLDHVVDQLRSPRWLLAFTYAPLDRPLAGCWPNLHYVGAPMPDGAADVPPVELPDGDDPLVVVAFSTSDMGQRPVVQRVVEALSTMPVRTLVTLGPALAPADLDLPANATAVPFVRHDDVLPRATAIVSHVGHGTLAAAVRNGVPIIAMPMGRDQHINAATVEALGIGRIVEQNAEPDAIAEAVTRLIADDDVRAASRSLAAQVASHQGVDRAAELVAGPVPGGD